MVPAELIGEDASSWFRTITIDKGGIDGVRKGMVVVAANGLVGHIIKTSRNYSKVLLITDYNSSVDAICQNSRARGIVQGKVEDCDLKYVSRRDEVSPGERVMTSGIGGRFPKGLVIGSVTRVDKNSYGFFQKVEVTPAVDFKKLEEVCLELKSIADKTGVKIVGPVPLPTKHLRVPVLKSPCGEGTQTWDKWEMRIHKRLIDIDSEERVMRRIMRIRVPEEVFVSIELL